MSLDVADRVPLKGGLGVKQMVDSILQHFRRCNLRHCGTILVSYILLLFLT